MLERHVVRQLTAYCHRELTAAEADRVQRHLQTCAPCQREYEDIRLAVDLARQLSLQRAPDSLWVDVVRGLDDSPPALPGGFTTPANRFRRQGAFAVAGLLLFAALGTS